ncbi:beta-lactamase family protein [Paenibacillus rhizovicinus]|uniref:Beta-lactamase family protein n=1 Tax=Paenibacillus rhizovicinus TaxID=2704463 RepID=A0A6C0PAL3_9BACL|nr:serine hydrolase domain-containing protein [Paenibacillus rhizovicinus]QHW33582.1 beta-lactamase family protein [Paenibacillus rhizovicinus]
MTNLQTKMQRALDEAVAQGRERGVQLVAYYRGERVVDAWSGIADIRTGRLVDGDTLFPVFSTTKGIAATVLHLLAERGQLDYDRPIADYWPAFGVNGKSTCTVRHALNHTAGIPYMPEGIRLEDAHDWDRMCTAVAGLTPHWPPGEHREYHAITYGWLVGEVARLVDGREFSRILQEDIAVPLGIADGLFVGIPDEAEPRVAYLEEPGFDAATLPQEGPQSVPAWIQPLGGWMNGAAARRACLPASNGIMSARAGARFYAALLPQGVDGIELLPPSRVKLATVPLVTPDGVVHELGLGYDLGGPNNVTGPHATSFGHGGYGGSLAYADPESGLAVAYANNLFSSQCARDEIVALLKRELGIGETPVEQKNGIGG